MTMDTATDAMRVILDKPDSVEAQSAVQHLLALVIERRDSIAFVYLGTLLRQTIFPALVTYARPYFVQAWQRSESQVKALEAALATNRKMLYEVEKDYLRLQTLEQLWRLKQTPQLSEDISQRAALSLQESLLLLQEEVAERLKRIAQDYPILFGKHFED